MVKGLVGLVVELSGSKYLAGRKRSVLFHEQAKQPLHDVAPPVPTALVTKLGLGMSLGIALGIEMPLEIAGIALGIAGIALGIDVEALHCRWFYCY